MSNDYSQPEFYRFNSDSIDLIKWIVSLSLVPETILDLGAGCGIIGIELARELHPKKLTLVELQSEYLNYLKKNVQVFSPQNTQTEIIISSFSQFKSKIKYDLIVSNPPYYLPKRGELPQNRNRAIARSFLEDNWNILLNRIQQSLSEGGKAFIVIKNDKAILEIIEKEMSEINLRLISHQNKSVLFLELMRLNKE